jgi:hypothetical protein
MKKRAKAPSFHKLFRTLTNGDIACAARADVQFFNLAWRIARKPKTLRREAILVQRSFTTTELWLVQKTQNDALKFLIVFLQKDRMPAVRQCRIAFVSCSELCEEFQSF